MRKFYIALAAFSIAAPVVAHGEPTPTPAAATSPVLLTVGQVLHASDNSKIGTISRVDGDGSVQVVYDDRIVRIPGSTLSVAGGKAKTSLSKHDLSGL